MLRRAVLLASALLALTASGSGSQIRENTTYFMVRGSTFEEIDADLRREGPQVGEAGLRHPGATNVRFDGSVTYRTDGARCRVDEVALSLDLEMTLPKWRGARSASRETALIWRVVADDIARHEQMHADIAKSHLRRMESALRNLAPRHDCDSMEAHVDATVQRYLRDHERAQRRFDVVEGREINRRLNRALRDNLLAETTP